MCQYPVYVLAHTERWISLLYYIYIQLAFRHWCLIASGMKLASNIFKWEKLHDQIKHKHDWLTLGCAGGRSVNLLQQQYVQHLPFFLYSSVTSDSFGYPFHVVLSGWALETRRHLLLCSVAAPVVHLLADRQTCWHILGQMLPVLFNSVNLWIRNMLWQLSCSDCLKAGYVMMVWYQIGRQSGKQILVFKHEF